MKVFISWSGKRSNRVAELFRTWIKCVLQASEPWISSQDIENGSWWFNEISGQLAETTVGVVFLTQENINKPWILFETGALAKGLSTSRVSPFLIDLKKEDVSPPLSQLNLTNHDKNGVFTLVRTINGMLATPLTQDVLSQVFEKYWSDFENGFNKIILETEEPTPTQHREEGDKLDEILLLIRGLDSRVRKVEINHSSSTPLALNGKLKSSDLFGLKYSIRQYLEYSYYNTLKFPSKEQATIAMSQNYDLPMDVIRKTYDEEYLSVQGKADQGQLSISDSKLKEIAERDLKD